jgi:colanic acid biosynthesis glycosyl transferase WcaI
MKLLLLCPHFEPDLHAATGEVMTTLVHSLAERGHRIDVVTSLPWYRGHTVHEGWRGRPWRTEEADHGRVVRVWPFPVDKNNIPARALGFGGFTALVAGAALTLSSPDVVMGMSPPVFLGDAAWLAAKRFRVPFVFNVQDIFPDVAVDLGALNNERVIAAARAHERSLYRRADAVTVLSTDQQRNVQAKMDPADGDKVRIIHNFADTDRVRVVDRASPYRDAHGLAGKQVVMYSGNVGLSQSFDLVRAAADRFADRPDVHFVINGEGAGRPSVDEWAQQRPNVTVADFAPREGVSDVLGAADLHLILLKRGLAQSSTPSKMYGILAAARAVLASIDEGSEVERTIQAAGAGRAVPPDDEEAFLAALEEMLADPEALESMGRRGRAHLAESFSPAAQAAAFEDLFADLIDAGPIKADPIDADPINREHRD